MNTLPNVWRARSPENRQPLGLDDLKDVDETMAQHLEWLLDNQVPEHINTCTSIRSPTLVVVMFFDDDYNECYKNSLLVIAQERALLMLSIL